tara:strand:- start:87 stop:758 length:672 start_codon:yes stop_codon:yes gene_type:complete
MINKELQKRTLSSLILIPASLFFIIKGSIFFIFFLSACFLIASYEWYNLSKNKPYNIPGHLFLIISFYFAYLWRHYLSLDAEPFLLVILVCVFTDIGGFTFGKIFKGPKLTKISPNKTYAGVLGGYVFPFTILIILLYFDFYFSIITLDALLDMYNIIFVFAISTVSQLGDIVISYFKRQSKKEDTGNLIPGHGGILDRIDGMIFAFPIIYLIYFHKYGFWIW